MITIYLTVIMIISFSSKIILFGVISSPGRAIVLPLASALAAALAKNLTLKFFYMMGKALSGELSCPCDRSCSIFILFLNLASHLARI